MLFPNVVVYQNIISGIIAPHGITDLFHAKQNHHMKQLLSINVACASSSMFLHHSRPIFYIDASFLFHHLFIFAMTCRKYFQVPITLVASYY